MNRLLLSLIVTIATLCFCCLASAAPFAPSDSFDQSLGRRTPAVKVYAAPTPVQVTMQWQSMAESISLVPLALKYDVLSESQSVDPVDQPEETLFSPPADADSEAAILNREAPAAGDFVAMIGLLLPESDLLAEIRLESEKQTAARQSGTASTALLSLARFSR